MKALETKIIALLLYADASVRTDIIPYLLTHKFLDINNEIIFRSITELHNEGNETIDPPMIYYTLKNKGINTKELIQHLSYMNTQGLNYADIFKYTSLLMEAEYKEKIKTTVNEWNENTADNISVDEMDLRKHNLIADLNELSYGTKTEYLDFEHYKNIYLEHAESGGGAIGYKWGDYLKDIDKITGGIIIPRVYVVGGLKKSGKTRFLIHTAKELYKQGIPTTILELEMPESDISRLLIASFLEIDDYKIMHGDRLDKGEKEHIMSLDISPNILQVDCCSGLNISNVIAKLQEYVKADSKVIMIDYIQRILHDQKRQAQELEAIAIALADFARKENVALIIVSQLQNIGEKEEPTIGHLKGSGGIAESADTIILLDNIFRRTKKESEQGKVILHFEQRHGLSGTEKIQCDLGKIQFRDLTK